MGSFSGYLKKEFYECTRTKRFLIMCIVFIALATLDVVMIKLLPIILEASMAQMPEDMAATYREQLDMMSSENLLASGVAAFIVDMVQTGVLAVSLCMMGLVASEFSKKTVVIPKLVGLNWHGFILSKIIINGIAIFIVMLISIFYSLGLSFILFGSGEIDLLGIIFSSIYMTFYFIFVTTLCIFFGTLMKNGVLSALCSIVTTILLGLLPTFFQPVSFPKLQEYFPTAIISSAQALDSTEFAYKSLLVIVIACVIMLVCSILLNKRREVV